MEGYAMQCRMKKERYEESRIENNTESTKPKKLQMPAYSDKSHPKRETYPL